jgi:hypothetical protein
MPANYIWYLPIEADDLMKSAKDYHEHMTQKGNHGSIIAANGKPNRRLAGIGDWVAVYVLIHGVTLQPRLSARGKQLNTYQLGELLEGEKLPKSHVDLRLFACYSALATRIDQPSKTPKQVQDIKKELAKALPINQDGILSRHGFNVPERYTGSKYQDLPMAAALCAHMKHERSYYRLLVTGYKGGITQGMSTFVSEDGYGEEKHKRVEGKRASEAKIIFRGDFDPTKQRWV